MRRWLAATLWGASLVVTASASAQPAAPPSPDARALVIRMGELLGTTERLSVTARTAYDVVQPSGVKVEWNDAATLTLRRPDRLRMEAERSNGARSLVVFDGKEITTFDEAGRAYAKAPQPGGVDETLVHFVRDLGMRLPLAVLFVSRAGDALDRRVKTVQYVEKTGILGELTHHVVGRTDSVDFQVWIADGAQPLPRRIVLTYRGAPGQPQFRADFSAWNLAADAADARFTFTPPDGARQIPFAAALPAVAKKGAR
jgi:hypothetical protein